MAKPRTIQIISHGPSCLDGVMAAAAIARFFEGNRVLASLPGNNESDRAIQNLKVRDKSGADEIWITDLSWNQPQTAAHLKELSEAGAAHLLDRSPSHRSLARRRARVQGAFCR